MPRKVFANFRAMAESLNVGYSKVRLHTSHTDVVKKITVCLETDL